MHDQALAEVPLPYPLPEGPALPPSGPSWDYGGLGEPTAVVRAAVAAAKRIHGDVADAPESVGWLLDEEFALGEPYGTTGEFLGDLADTVAHQGRAPKLPSRRYRSSPSWSVTTASPSAAG